MRFDVDSDGLVIYTNKLEKLHRAAFPNAVRNTLNDLAFETKLKNLIPTTEKEFNIREKTFFKANSSVEKAKGFEMRSMESVVGMRSNKPKGANDYAVKDLEKQEYGGTITNKAFIASYGARIGKKGRVRPNMRLNALGTINEQKNVKNRRVSFAIAVKENEGGFFKGGVKDKDSVFSVNNGKTKLVHSYEKGRNTKVKPTKFMEQSSLKSMRNLDVIYIRNAKKQIEKYMK
jgi:hypothetical protein